MWLWILVIILILLLLFFFLPKPNRNLTPGFLNDVDSFLAKLIENNHDDSFLIIEIAENKDFVQFKYSQNEGLLIDFPLVSESQKKYKHRILRFCENNQMTYEYNDKEEDGAVDIIQLGDKDQLIELVKSILMDIFEVDDKKELLFELEL